MIKNRQKARRRRHLRVRKKVQGTLERPRLVVFRSQRHLYVQLVDDNFAGGGAKTLCSASTLSKELGASLKNDCETARRVGQLLGRKARDCGIETVVFDRGGYRYHGRVKSLAEGAREAGLQF